MPLNLLLKLINLLLKLYSSSCRLLDFGPELVCAILVSVQVLQLELELLNLLRLVFPQLFDGFECLSQASPSDFLGLCRFLRQPCVVLR